MIPLMPEKCKGTYAHRGTQPLTVPEPSSSSTPLDIPSSSSTPLNISSKPSMSFGHLSSSASSKRKMPSSVVAASSSSNKRIKQITVEENLERVSGAIDNLHSAVDKVSHVTGKHGLEALGVFIDMVNRSREDGDEWLSQEEIMTVTEKFGNDDYMAGSFVALLKLKDEKSAARTWIRNFVLRG
jgi:hypothetical protein